MLKVAFMIGTADTVEAHNFLHFANHLVEQGTRVFCAPVETLALHESEVSVLAAEVREPLREGQTLNELEFSRTQLGSVDVAWLLSLGYRETFLDKMQLLYNVRREVRIINSLEALMYLKSKYYLPSLGDVFKHPETFASADFDYLWARVSGSGKKWIVKPPAGSFGRDVFMIDANDPNARAVLQTMTGHNATRYCLLQEYIGEIEAGEKRVLVAAGSPVGQYRRRSHLDHRTNLHQGAAPEPCDLTPAERSLCETVGAHLHDLGARYVAIDLAYPYVIEFNVVNPGGLTTIESLTGESLAPTILARVLHGLPKTG